MSDQWSEITSSSHPSVDNVRRVESHYPLDFRRGKDFYLRYIFVLEGTADAATLPVPPSRGGIDVSNVFDEVGTCKLTLTLLDSAYLEIFRVLCRDLLSSTSSLPRGEDGRGLVIVLKRLLRWQELLRRRRDDLLTSQQIIGLMGELLFLRDKVFPLVGDDAIYAWRGPYGEERDFVHGQWIFEIKTQLSTADQRICISQAFEVDINVLMERVFGRRT
jgi:hypothetical protein